MKIFISTGEVSGDLQGSMLIESLYKIAAQKNINLEIAGLGGDRMEATGANIIANTAAIGSMGFIEGLPFVLPTIKIQSLTKKYIQTNTPNILVLIDYPTPNLALASYVKKHFPQIPVVYYIAPQDWAVPMLNNASKIAQIVDKLLAIFPAEAKYFSDKDIDVTWVGHPLLDRLATAPDRNQARLNLSIEPEEQIITLLPASRQQEIKYLLPVIAQAAQQIQQQQPNIKFLIPVSLPSYKDIITSVVEQHNLAAKILTGDKTLDAIAAADLAIAKSGTVNLEIALLNIPQVVIYRVNPLTAWIARKILRFSIPLMSPPNLIVNQKIVPELQQEDVTADNIVTEAIKLLSNPQIRAEIIAGYQQMRSLLDPVAHGRKGLPAPDPQDRAGSLLGTLGVCDRAAVEIFNLANKIPINT